MSALRMTGEPLENPLASVRSAIAVAYEQVRSARRCLAATGAPSQELVGNLQRAEADLVRSLVEIERLERETRVVPSGDQLIPITKRRTVLPRTA